MIDQLRNLVQEYVAGRIAYEAFRQRFISLYVVATDSGDANIELIFDSLEARCSAFGHQLINESRLKFVFASFVSQSMRQNVPQNISANVSIVMNVPQMVGAVPARAANVAQNPLSGFGSNSSPQFLEPELEDATV